MTPEEIKLTIAEELRDFVRGSEVYDNRSGFEVSTRIVDLIDELIIARIHELAERKHVRLK